MEYWRIDKIQRACIKRFFATAAVFSFMWVFKFMPYKINVSVLPSKHQNYDKQQSSYYMPFIHHRVKMNTELPIEQMFIQYSLIIFGSKGSSSSIGGAVQCLILIIFVWITYLYALVTLPLFSLLFAPCHIICHSASADSVFDVGASIAGISDAITISQCTSLFSVWWWCFLIIICQNGIRQTSEMIACHEFSHRFEFRTKTIYYHFEHQLLLINH